MEIRTFFSDRKDALLSAIVMTLSSIIAFTIYRYFHWSDGSWAIISIAAVTQTHVKNTINKISLRLIGTIIGAGSAYFFVSQLPIFMLSPVFFICIFLCMFFTLAATSSRYLMIITGLTFTLVISAGMTGSVEEMAFIRTYEVIFGSLVCSVISLLVGYFYPEVGGEKQPLRFHFVFHRGIVIQALVMSAACGVTFYTWLWLQYPLGFWAIITCLFVIEENIGKTIKKIWMRLRAHILVAIFAGIVALFISANSNWIILPVSIGLFACGYCLGLKSWLSEIATTAAIAISVVFLIDAPGLSQFQIVMARLFNVIYGVSVAFVVIYLSSAIEERFKSMH